MARNSIFSLRSQVGKVSHSRSQFALFGTRYFLDTLLVDLITGDKKDRSEKGQLRFSLDKVNEMGEIAEMII